MGVNKIIKTGIIDGSEYHGHVTEQGGKYVGTVHQVPEENATSVFIDAASQSFDTLEEAEAFVSREWERRFGKKSN